MAITVRQIRYFLVLSEELHFGRAAERLHVSQPPLSASLKQLEEAVGVRLLERNSKRVELTRAGEVFRRHARQALTHLDDSIDLVRRIEQGATGRLRIGFTPAMLFRQVPEVLDRFKQDYPGIELQLVEQNSLRQIEAVTAGQLDVGFVHAIPFPEALHHLTISDEPFLGCLPRGHSRAADQRIQLSDLAEEPLIMFDRALAPYYYDRIMGLFHVHDLSPHIAHEVSHWLTILALISRGLGAAVVPESLARSGLADVAFLPIADVDLRHQSCCVWRAEELGPNAQRFVDLVGRVCAQEAATG